jgi:type I restriction enzyme S subunit
MKAGWRALDFTNCIDKVIYTSKIQRNKFLSEGVYPVVSQEEDLINGYWNDENDVFKILKPVIVFGDHTKVIKYIDFNFVLGADGVKLLQPKDFLFPRFFYYQLQALRLDTLGYARHFRLLKEVSIKYPPLAEQKRIVAILDEAFAAIAKARENAEKNLANAREVFESYLNGVFSNPRGKWQTVTLSELSTEITDGDHLPPPKAVEGVPFITISNINKHTNQIDFTNTFHVPIKYYESLKHNKKPQKGDVLYTVTGSYGIPVLINNDFQFCFQRHIGLIRPNSKLNSKLLYYWIRSSQAKEQAKASSTGTAQKTVSLKSLRNFIIPLMSIKIQHAIVAKLDALFTETKRLEEIYRKKIAALDELKKSILDEAFKGELTR